MNINVTETVLSYTLILYLIIFLIFYKRSMFHLVCRDI